MVVLAEHSTADLSISRQQGEALQRSGFVNVSPAAGDRWTIKTTSYVGSLVTEGVELLIRPKINPENLFLLLEPGLPENAWRREAFEYGESSNLLPSVIAFFARAVETTLGRGLLRSYETRHEDLVALRGRMDLPGQFRNAGLTSPVSCTFDEYSQNTAENHALRAAVRFSLRVPRLHPEVRQRLMRQLAALEDVDDVAVSPEHIDGIHMTRLNEHYRPALRLARLILANLSLTDTHGSTFAQSFMVDMNDLFQRFVTERLSHVLRGRIDVSVEPTQHLGVGRQIPMQPDLVFKGLDGVPRLVGDIKYKLAGGAQARSQDHYQLLAYTTAMGLPEGFLIYCSDEEGGAKRTVSVRNAAKRLTVQALDFTGSPRHVDRQIERLAADVISAIGHAHPRT